MVQKRRFEPFHSVYSTPLSATDEAKSIDIVLLCTKFFPRACSTTSSVVPQSVPIRKEFPNSNSKSAVDTSPLMTYTGVIHFVTVGAMSESEHSTYPDGVEHVVEADSPSRRRFLGFLAGIFVMITGAGIVAPLAGMLLAPLFARSKENWLTLGALGDLVGGGPTRFTYRYIHLDGWFAKTIIGTVYVIRDGSRLAAISNICTHLGCGVRWDPDKNDFICPCHNGVFDRNGNVVSGPPPKPLNRFPTRVASGKIQIRVEEA